MAENYQHLYQQMKKMVEMYQDEIVPGMWKTIEKQETIIEDMRQCFVDYVCSGIQNPAPYCANKICECVDGRGWCKEDPASCRGFNPLGERKDNATV